MSTFPQAVLALALVLVFTPLLTAATGYHIINEIAVGGD